MIIRSAAVIVAMVSPPAFADTLTVVRVIRASALIEPGDITISEVSVPGALTSEVELDGMEARVTLFPGRPIMPAHVGPAALVVRNQPVTLFYSNGGLSIATEARALSRGSLGDTVRVMNIASRNTVLGRVRSDGNVEVTRER